MKDFSQFEAQVNSSFENGIKSFSEAREYIRGISSISNKSQEKYQKRDDEERI